MNMHKICKKVSNGNNIDNTPYELIRLVLPNNPVKRLASLMGISLSSAHAWVHREVSASRRRELADALIAEFDRQDRERPAIRRRLIEMRNAGGSIDWRIDGALQAPGAGNRGGARVARAQA